MWFSNGKAVLYLLKKCKDFHLYFEIRNWYFFKRGNVILLGETKRSKEGIKAVRKLFKQPKPAWIKVVV